MSYFVLWIFSWPVLAADLNRRRRNVVRSSPDLQQHIINVILKQVYRPG